MTIQRQALARRGEECVARHLARQGYQVLGMNVRAGRRELDVVAERDGLLVVCEVRSRSTDRYGSPAETIGYKKVQRVRQATRVWMRASTCASFVSAARTARGVRPSFAARVVCLA